MNNFSGAYGISKYSEENQILVNRTRILCIIIFKDFTLKFKLYVNFISQYQLHDDHMTLYNKI